MNNKTRTPTTKAIIIMINGQGMLGPVPTAAPVGPRSSLTTGGLPGPFKSSSSSASSSSKPAEADVSVLVSSSSSHSLVLVLVASP